MDRSTGLHTGLRALGFILLSSIVPLASGQNLLAAPEAALGAAGAAGATTVRAAPPSMTADQIVDRLIAHNQQQSAALRGYVEERHYTVAYHGFPALKATMTVEAIYDAPSTKRFLILSQSGPGVLVDHVLKRLLESEQEAARDPREAAMTPANYTFTLLGQDTVDGRPSWVLHAEPKGNAKFLFRGRIWVDAQDDAVTRIDAEPAKSPSFWIRKTQIHHVYEKTGPFWLPETNESETSVRLGGTAVLTIDYGTYRIGETAMSAIDSPSPVKSDTALPETASPGASR